MLLSDYLTWKISKLQPENRREKYKFLKILGAELALSLWTFVPHGRVVYHFKGEYQKITACFIVSRETPIFTKN